MQLRFLGAAGEVTGSCFNLITANSNILVDCGLFQGQNDKAKNDALIQTDVPAIKYLFLTHAHLDHVGRLGRLLSQDFQGQIVTTAPTLDLARLVLEDAAHLNNRSDEKSDLFDITKITVALNNAKIIKYFENFKFDDVAVKFIDAGHILGSASLIVETEGKRLVFSGDIGNPPVPLLSPPQIPLDADYVVMESTYGGRIHESTPERHLILKNLITSALKEQGTILMPSFAIERTQEVLSELNGLIESKQLPRFPVYLDSPMAYSATKLFAKYRNWFNPQTRSKILQGDDVFHFPGLKIIKDANESKALNLDETPKLIIAGAGMMNGGRIVHHLKRWAPRSNTVIIIIGYQVEGTLGRQIYDGTRSVKINGDIVKINAKVKAIGAYSSHADQAKLLQWLSRSKPTNTFIVHGETQQSSSLARAIKQQYNLTTTFPVLNQTFEF